MYPDQRQSKTKESPLVNIKRGIVYAARNNLIRVLLIQSVIIAMLSMPFQDAGAGVCEGALRLGAE